MFVFGLLIDLCYDVDDLLLFVFFSCIGGVEERNSFWGCIGGFCIYFFICVCFWVDD